MKWLVDSVALVTGAGSGIGKAIAQRFVEEGAQIVAFDNAPERLAALRREMGDSLVTVQGDVRSLPDNQRAVALAVSRFGKLDIFVGNAGIWDGGRRLSDLQDEQIAAGFDEVFAINVKGYLLGAKAASEALRRRRGCMIFTLSTSSFYVGGGGPIYIAAKHATLGLVRALAHEFAPDIRVNGVAPSGTPTAMADAAALPKAPSRGSPPPGNPDSNLLRVAVQADDHAGAYVLLASQYARTMTGTIINSDGGRGVMAARAG